MIYLSKQEFQKESVFNYIFCFKQLLNKCYQNLIYPINLVFLII